MLIKPKWIRSTQYTLECLGNWVGMKLFWYMSDYYLFGNHGVWALSQKKTLSRKNYFKGMTSSRMYRIFVIKWWRHHQIFEFWILQFIYLHCVKLLWKNQVSIINYSKVITMYILNIFPCWANFEQLVSTIFLWKIIIKISYLHQAEIFTGCLGLIFSHI